MVLNLQKYGVGTLNQGFVTTYLQNIGQCVNQWLCKTGQNQKIHRSLQKW